VDTVAGPTPLVPESPSDDSGDDSSYEETEADPVPSRPTTPMPSTSQLPTPRPTDPPPPEIKSRLRSQAKKKSTVPALQLHLLVDWKQQADKRAAFKISNGCPFDLYFTTTLGSKLIIISADNHYPLKFEVLNNAVQTQKFVVRAQKSASTPALNEAAGWFLLVQSDGLGFGEGSIAVSQSGSPPPASPSTLPR